MKAIALIARRELGAYLRGMSGYVIVALILAIDGLLFNTYAMGGRELLSAEVLRKFFYFSSGTTMTAAILLSMRLLSEEAHDKTLVLLYTAPVSEWQIAVGKWLSAFCFLCLMLLLSLYMPLLILVHGTINPGHLAAGYAGLLLIGAASTAIGTFASSLTRSQVVAGIAGGAIVVGLLLSWMLARVVDPPFDTIFSYLSFWDKHFTPFMDGVIHTRDVVYYLSIAFLSLVLTKQVLGARRWR